MATNMPGALDAFTNPVGGQLLSNAHVSKFDQLQDSMAQVEKILVGPTYHNLYGFGADPSGASSSDTAFDAVLAAGAGIITAPPGVYLLGSNHKFLQGVNIQCGGGGQLGSSVVFKCTAAGAGLAFGDIITARNGGTSGGFTVDANHVATRPFYVGIEVGRTFRQIDVINADATGAVGVLIQGAQNCKFTEVNVETCYDGFTFDLTAGTNHLDKCEVSGFTRAALNFVQSGAVPGPLGPAGSNVGPLNNRVTDTNFERAATGALAVVIHGAGTMNCLGPNNTFQDGSACTLGGMLYQNKGYGTFPSILVLLRNDFNGTNTTGAAISFGAGCRLYMASHNILNNCTNGFALPAGSGGFNIVEDGTTEINCTNQVNVTGIYQDTWRVQSTRLLHIIKKLSVADTAEQLFVDGDTSPRWQLASNGTQSWGPGNAATDTSLARDVASGGIVVSKGVGKWGHAAPAAQPARCVTLADVIAVLAGDGTTA